MVKAGHEYDNADDSAHWAAADAIDSELIRHCTQVIKRRFLQWRDPPVELPPDSVIEEAVIEIAAWCRLEESDV